MPDAWYILLTHIRGSTQAVEAGRYKDVNLLGACSIVAVLTVAAETEMRFVLGGDRDSVLIEPQILPAAEEALLAVKKVAKSEYNLDSELAQSR